MNERIEVIDANVFTEDISDEGTSTSTSNVNNVDTNEENEFSNENLSWLRTTNEEENDFSKENLSWTKNEIHE